MMATTPFICNVEDSVESLQTPTDNKKVRLGVFYKVFMAVMILLVMGLIGGFIWMHLSYKDCPQCSHHPDWLAINATVTFDGKINFTAPKEGKYLIHGQILRKEGKIDGCSESIRLIKTSLHMTDDIITRPFCNDEVQFVVDIELRQGEKLLLGLNCEENQMSKTQINERSSFLKIYERNFDRCLY